MLLHANILKSIHPAVKTCMTGKCHVSEVKIDTFICPKLQIQTADVFLELDDLSYPENIPKFIEFITLNIECQPMIPVEWKPFYLKHRTALLMCCLTYSNLTDLSLLFANDINEIHFLRELCIAIQNMLLDSFHSEKEKFLTDLMDFYWYILDACISTSLEKYKTTYLHHRPATPPYISPKLKKRLAIIQIHPSEIEVVNELQKSCFPMPFLYMPLKSKKKYLWDTNAFLALIEHDLPEIKPAILRSTDFIVQFKEKLWAGHQFLPSHLGPFQKIKTNFTDRQILEQVLCYLLPNWQQVWCELGLPASFEVQRRLRFMKKEGWKPPVQSFIKLILH
jgi:hypothetical protein